MCIYIYIYMYYIYMYIYMIIPMFPKSCFRCEDGPVSILSARMDPSTSKVLIYAEIPQKVGQEWMGNLVLESFAILHRDMIITSRRISSTKYPLVN